MDSRSWCVLSFGGGSLPFRNAARRFRSSARRSRWFREVRVYDDRSLEREFPEFVRRHRKALVKRSKGYGYYIWKSFLVRETLKTLPRDCSGVVWIDSGCSLNINALSTKRMQEYCTLAQEHGTLSFQLPHHLDSEYTKADVLAEFNLPEYDICGPQLISGAIFFSHTTASLSLAQDWHAYACVQDYRFSDDTPSRLPERPSFIAHRHDQSLWSMVAKRSGEFALESDETWFGPNWHANGTSYPIWALRQRSGISPFHHGIFWDVLRQLESQWD